MPTDLLRTYPNDGSRPRGPAAVGNVVVYSDVCHLTRSYSRSLAGPLLGLAPVLR